MAMFWASITTNGFYPAAPICSESSSSSILENISSSWLSFSGEILFFFFIEILLASVKFSYVHPSFSRASLSIRLLISSSFSCGHLTPVLTYFLFWIYDLSGMNPINRFSSGRSVFPMSSKIFSCCSSSSFSFWSMYYSSMNCETIWWSLDNSWLRSGQISNMNGTSWSSMCKVIQIMSGVKTLTQSLGILNILSSNNNVISAIYFKASYGLPTLNTFYKMSWSVGDSLSTCPFSYCFWISFVASLIVACAMNIRMRLTFWSLSVSPCLLVSFSTLLMYSFRFFNWISYN